MTKEEEKYTTLDLEQCKWWVIALFSMQKSLACQTNNFDDAEEIQAAQDKIIKALEQQPSDDCVSRKAVIDAVENTIAKYIPTFIGQYEKIPLELARAIKDVSPIIPTRKSELHWIERFDNENKWLECPHCHKDSDNAYNYCPNCGAEMRGSKNG